MWNEILLNAVDRFERIRDDYVSNIIVALTGPQLLVCRVR